MEDKKLTFVVCDGSSVNSYGFMIDIDGIDTKRFENNPVMLYQHRSEEVIGKWHNIRKENNKLIADADFDAEDPEAQRIKGKIERGYLRGSSMGIIIHELEKIDDIYLATKSELMEVSIAVIPADAGAITLYDQHKQKTDFQTIKLQFNKNKNIKDMENNKVKNPEDNIKTDEIAALQAEVARLEDENINSFLDLSISQGKIEVKEKESLKKLAKLDFEAVKELVAPRECKQSVSLKDLQTSKFKASDSDRANWSYLDWMKKDEKGLKRMKLENPQLFTELQEELITNKQ